MKIKRNKKGFTIIELVIVVAVIGVLAAILIPTFLNLNKGAQGAADDALVAQLNTQLKIDEQAPTFEKKSLHQAILSAEKIGYKLVNLKTTSGDKLLWNQEKNEFFLEAKKDTSYPDYQYWEIADAVPTTQQYSIYAGSKFEARRVEKLEVGFDVGEHKDIEFVEYVGKDGELRENKSQRVVIRVNDNLDSSYRNFTSDYVDLYGEVSDLNAENNGTHSLHFHGNASSLHINQGHISLDPSSVIDTLFIETNASTSFAEFSVDVPEGTTIKNVVRQTIGTAFGDEKVKIGTFNFSDKSRTYYLTGNGALQDNKLLVSTDDDPETAVPVEEAEATPLEVAIANSKVAGQVVDNGKTKQEIKTEAIDVENKVKEEIVNKDKPEGVEYAARIALTGYTTFNDAYNAAQDGDVITLMKDLDLRSYYGGNTSKRFPITKSIILDGGNKTVQVEGRGFGLGAAKIGFRNVTITNTISSGRVLDIRSGTESYDFVEELTLDNVVISTPNTATQPITIGGNTSYYRDENNQVKHIKLLINDSRIMTQDDGSWGYGITVFNPVDATIKNSTLGGWAIFNMKGASSSFGSKGSNIYVENSTLISKNVYAGLSGGNSYSLIKFEDTSTTFPVTVSFKGCDIQIIADASDTYQSIFSFENTTRAPGNFHLLEGNRVTFVDNGTASYHQAIFGRRVRDESVIDVANGNVFVSSYADFGVEDYLNSNQQLKDNGDGTFTVITK